MAAAALLAAPFDPNTGAIKRRLLRHGVVPTPKILHALKKKETLKSLRRSKKLALQNGTPPISEAQRKTLEEESQFRAVASEYRAVKRELERAPVIKGKPWERSTGVDLSGLRREGDGGERLKGEFLEELRVILEERKGKGLQWLLDDDVEGGEGPVREREKKDVPQRQNYISEDQKIRLLVHRLCSENLDMNDWKFPRLMKQQGLLFTEMHLLKIVEELGVRANWRQALSVIEWVYNEEYYKHRKSRFVYTKLLAVLGKARRPVEALKIFNLMREDGQIYPDMAAYHTIAVTLGQAGLVKELVNIVECMKQKPTKRIKNMKHRNWDPCLEPDLIVYNAVLNACVPSSQWKGVYWVMGQMRHNGLKPTGATYGLAMEVMLKARKYNLVHKFFEKMQKGGFAPRALTYRVLVRAFWEESKVGDAVKAVRDMEHRGVVGTASVYYELACSLCNNGRWEDAMLEVEKLKRLPLTKPLEVTFTGMILSSMDGGYFYDGISIFEQMKDYCTPNVGTINAMLKIYRHNDMFAEARELFESIKDISGSNTFHGDGTSPKPDLYTYASMLEASASAQQWEYFEYVYKEMTLCGYRLDQNKHSWLLVEASRDGKWHILEHAFDTILEDGGVPHVSIFTEMIIQTIVRQDFERTVPLINGMAHASIQFAEYQWTNLFNRNMDRLGKDNLENLTGYLNHSNLVMEDPIPDLLKSLHCLHGKGLSKNVSLLSAPDDISEDTSTRENEKGVEGCEEEPIISVDNASDHSFSFMQEFVDDATTVVGDEGRDSKWVQSEQGSTRVAFRSIRPKGSDLRGIWEIEDIRKPGNLDSKGKNVKFIPHGDSDASVTDEAVDLLTGHIGNPFSDLPLASNILENWREERMKGGGIF